MADETPARAAVWLAAFKTADKLSPAVNFPVHFNPASLQYSVSNKEQGQGKKKKQHVSETSAQLSMELLFDTTDTGRDVRLDTGEIVKLLSPDDKAKKAPRMVEFSWGTYSFTGVIEQYKETLDFFSADGVPLRASVSVTLTSKELTFADPERAGASVDSELTPQPVVVGIVDDLLSDNNISSVVIFAFSEAPVGFTEADIQISAGLTLVAGSLVQDGGNPLLWTATVTADDDFDGDGTVTIGTAWTDAATNPGIGADDMIDIDTENPGAQDDTAAVEEGDLPETDVVLILDRSGSMQGIFQQVKDAIETLFNSGSVRSVFLVSFSSNATFHSSGVNDGWFTDLDAALAAVDALSASGATDYDAALDAVMDNFTTPPAGGDRLVAMFLSDGAPTENNGTGSNGIDEDDANGNPAPGGEETDWINFLTDNGFSESFAFGFGGLGAGEISRLEPIAWAGPGETADNPYDADNNASAANDPNVIIVSNLNDLAAELTGSIPASVVGNVLDNDALAVGDRILSIQVGTVTYTYDPIGHDITASSGPNPPEDTELLTVNTPESGTLEFNFVTGDWGYSTPPGGVNEDTPEIVTYVLIDDAGNQATAHLRITIDDGLLVA
jgi:Contractile injection system tube protein/von Willebrand factor type A domain/Bacterial Ig-like domain